MLIRLSLFLESLEYWGSNWAYIRVLTVKEFITMMKLIKSVFAAICSIIIEFCKGTEAFAKSYTELGESTHDYAKTLRITPEQLAADLEIARIEHQMQLVESLQKLKLRGVNDPKLSASIDAQLKAIEDTFK